MKHVRRSWVVAAVFIILSSNGGLLTAQPDGAQSALDKAKRAQLAFDSYYGQPERWKEAARLVKEILQTDPDNVTALVLHARMEIAWARRTKGEQFAAHRSKAYALADRALAADAKNAEALRIAGRMRHLDKDYVGARRFFDQALALHGVWPGLAYNYGLLLLSEANYESAGVAQDITLLDQSYKWFERALLQVDRLQGLSGLVGLSPAERNALSGSAYQLAYAALQKGDRVRAFALLEDSVLYANPTDGYRMVDVGRLYLQSGNYARAEQLAQGALNNLEFDHAKQILVTSRVMLAWQSYMRGEKEAGARWMDRAMAVKTSKRKVESWLRSGTPEMKEAALAYAWRFRIWGYIEAADALIDKLFGRQLFESDDLIRV